ncbi:hypothetical protein SGUI_3071 [Serinicoccus hydrothermalis]|uniref:Uncharacterized protein n=1 Tax=Serinicoccus hydrothermalis TaxID=1758689 RepID=A0A1B1NGB3_9MICO|nr:hypothetical protein SGUI_3071 [Serinicoccus hydrothermalis]
MVVPVCRCSPHDRTLLGAVGGTASHTIAARSRGSDHRLRA